MNPDSRPTRIAALLLAGLALAAYSPSLSGDFLLDDENYIVANPVLNNPRRWGRVFTDPAALTVDVNQAPMMYRPLTALSFAVNQRLGGYNPFWYHFASSALHAANAVMVFLLAIRLLGPSAGLWPPVGAAILFILHPAQVEGVAYISGSRATLLSTFFCLAAFLLYIGDGRRRLGLSLAAIVAALLSKESAFFLLPMLAAYDLYVRALEQGWRACVGRWAAFAGSFALYLGARRLVVGRFAQRGLWGESLLEHLGLAARGVFEDLRIAFWPASLRACYSFPAGEGSAWPAAWRVLVLLAFAGAALWLLRRRSLSGFALAWIAAALIPVSNLVPVDALAADRFLYAPLAGAALLWGIALSRFPAAPPWRAAPILGALGLGILLAPACLAQQAAWQNQFALDLASRAAAPRDPCAAVNLASHYYNWGDLSRAETLLTQALEPGAARHVRQAALVSLSLVRMKAKRFSEAVPLLEEALSRDPRLEGAHLLLGRCRLALGDKASAAGEFELEAARRP